MNKFQIGDLVRTNCGTLFHGAVGVIYTILKYGKHSQNTYGIHILYHVKNGSQMQHTILDIQRSPKELELVS